MALRVSQKAGDAMSSFSDRSKVNEQIEAALGPPRSPDDLPQWMRCPSGHTCQRCILEVQQIEPVEQIVLVPCYPCAPCQVAYRPQELSLVPGDEGAP